jgi:hypothetical protein
MIVARAVQKDPANRYKDLSTMRNDLAGVRHACQSAEPEVHDLETIGSAPMILEALRATPRPPRREPDREALARRRSAQVELNLEEAKRAIAAGDFGRAIKQALHRRRQTAYLMLCRRKALAKQPNSKPRHSSPKRASSLLGAIE